MRAVRGKRKAKRNREKSLETLAPQRQAAIWRGPPDIVLVRVSSFTMRYVMNTAATITISGKNLLNWVMIAATSTTSYRMFNAIRIKQFRLWSPPVVSGTSNTGTVQPGLTFEWYGPTIGYSPSRKQIASPMGVDPAFIQARPPKGSSQSFWMQSGSTSTDTTDTILAIFGPIGTVIDYTFTAIMVDDESPFGAEAPVAATVGKVYYNYLDGRSSGIATPAGVSVVP